MKRKCPGYRSPCSLEWTPCFVCARKGGIQRHRYLPLPEVWTRKHLIVVRDTEIQPPSLPLTLSGFSHQNQWSSLVEGCERHCTLYWQKRRDSISQKGKTQSRRLSFPSCSAQDWGKGLGRHKARWRINLPRSGSANARSPKSETSSAQPSHHAFQPCAEPRIWTICARSPQ